MNGDQMETLPATREIMQQTPAELGSPLGRLTKDVVQRAVEQAELGKELRLGMLRATSPAQWHDMDGKPYLKDPGIHAVARAIGLVFGSPEIRREDGEDAKGKFTRFTTKLAASWLGESFYDVGIASTRDPFFARKYKETVPYEDIDLGDAEKKSVTNARHRILVRALAIEGFTWEELEQEAGIKRPSDSVRYRGSEQRRTTGAGSWTKDKERLWGWLLEMAGGDVEGAAERLEGLTRNDAKGYKGYRDADRLSDGTMKWLLPRVEKLYSAWLDAQAPDQEAETSAKPAPVQKKTTPAAVPGKGGIDPRDDPSLAPRSRDPGEEG